MSVEMAVMTGRVESMEVWVVWGEGEGVLEWSTDCCVSVGTGLVGSLDGWTMGEAGGGVLEWSSESCVSVDGDCGAGGVDCAVGGASGGGLFTCGLGSVPKLKDMDSLGSVLLVDCASVDFVGAGNEFVGGMYHLGWLLLVLGGECWLRSVLDVHLVLGSGQ